MKIYIARESSVKLNISKVVKFLNRNCKFIQFAELPLSTDISEEQISNPRTHKKYLPEFKSKINNSDYVIIVSEVQYDNNYFYDEYNGVIIASFFAWKYLTKLPKENGLVYFICSMLSSEIIPFDEIDHTKRLGCINDFLFDKTRIDDGMHKGHFCDKCLQHIQKKKLSKYQTDIYEDLTKILQQLSEASEKNQNVITDKKSRDSITANGEPEPKISVSLKKQSSKSLFISYSHKDEKSKNELETHLSVLQKIGMINTWTDRKITAGSEWKNQIDVNLNNSSIILLLISSNFIASAYCYDIEMKTALKRHEEKKSIVIPVILRDCLWQIAPFAHLQALPTNGKPIQKFTRKDDAYTDVVRQINELIQGK